jgi:hypothetical protein
MLLLAITDLGGDSIPREIIKKRNPHSITDSTLTIPSLQLNSLLFHVYVTYVRVSEVPIPRCCDNVRSRSDCRHSGELPKFASVQPTAAHDGAKRRRISRRCIIFKELLTTPHGFPARCSSFLLLSGSSHTRSRLSGTPYYSFVQIYSS